MINIASGKMKKEEFAELLRELNDGLGK